LNFSSPNPLPLEKAYNVALIAKAPISTWRRYWVMGEFKKAKMKTVLEKITEIFAILTTKPAKL
jgi:hypothetical protein